MCQLKPDQRSVEIQCNLLECPPLEKLSSMGNAPLDAPVDDSSTTEAEEETDLDTSVHLSQQYTETE